MSSRPRDKGLLEMIRCSGGMGLTSLLLQLHRSCCPPWTPPLNTLLLFLNPGTPATLSFLSRPDNFPIHPVCLKLFKICVCYLQQRTSTDPWAQSSPLSFCEQSQLKDMPWGKHRCRLLADIRVWTSSQRVLPFRTIFPPCYITFLGARTG